MWSKSKCVKGSLIGSENLKSTQKRADVDFTYWQIGYKNATVQNCYLSITKIYVKPGNKALSSPLADITQCNYDDGSCILDDNSILVWHVNENAENLCQYRKMAKWKGNFMGKIWMAENGIFGFSFSPNPPEIFDCGRTLIISQQDFAIPKTQFSLMVSKMAQRTKRAYEPSDGSIRGSQLAAELTANQVLATNATRRAFNHLASLICSKKSNMDGMGNLVGGLDPTLFARVVLNTSYVQGRWVSARVLETKNCLPFPMENITFIPSIKCLRHISANATILERHFTGFLNPDTLILTEKSEEASCEFYRFVSMQIDGRLLQVDQLTGNIEIIEKKNVHPLRFGLSYALKNIDLEPKVFYNYILNNYTDPRIQTLQMFQTYRLDKRFEDEKLRNTLERGEWGDHIHKSSDQFHGLFPSWNGFGIDITWKEVWLYVCAMYVTYLILIDVVLPILLKQILIRTELDQYFRFALRNAPNPPSHPVSGIEGRRLSNSELVLPSVSLQENTRRWRFREIRNRMSTARARSVA